MKSIKILNHFFKNFDPKIDEHLFQALTQILFEKVHLTMFNKAMQPFQEINGVDDLPANAQARRPRATEVQAVRG